MTRTVTMARLSRRTRMERKERVMRLPLDLVRLRNTAGAEVTTSVTVTLELYISFWG